MRIQIKNKEPLPIYSRGVIGGKEKEGKREIQGDRFGNVFR